MLFYTHIYLRLPNMIRKRNSHQLTSLAKLEKNLEAHGCKPWVNQLIDHSPYIKYTNQNTCITYCIISPEYANRSQTNVLRMPRKWDETSCQHQTQCTSATPLTNTTNFIGIGIGHQQIASFFLGSVHVLNTSPIKNFSLMFVIFLHNRF